MSRFKGSPSHNTDTAAQGSAAVSVGTSSTSVASANASRVSITIANDHATNTVYLGFGTPAVASQGVRLNAAGGSFTTNSFTGQIFAISSGATTPVIVAEF